MDIEELKERQTPEKVQEKRYEEACRLVVGGHLNAQDVCRLWGTAEDVLGGTPGKRAAELVGELELPLMQIGIGSWAIAHDLSWYGSA